MSNSFHALNLAFSKIYGPFPCAFPSILLENAYKSSFSFSVTNTILSSINFSSYVTNSFAFTILSLYFSSLNFSSSGLLSYKNVSENSFLISTSKFLIFICFLTWASINYTYFNLSARSLYASFFSISVISSYYNVFCAVFLSSYKTII